jgi:hypothetical protein
MGILHHRGFLQAADRRVKQGCVDRDRKRWLLLPVNLPCPRDIVGLLKGRREMGLRGILLQTAGARSRAAPKALKLMIFA